MCCRFLLLRLLFIVVLCISIDISALFQFHSTFWRCFYESVCGQSVFYLCSACISRSVASFVCFFDSFCHLMYFIAFCVDGWLFVERLGAFVAGCCVCMCVFCSVLFLAIFCCFVVFLRFFLFILVSFFLFWRSCVVCRCVGCCFFRLNSIFYFLKKAHQHGHPHQRPKQTSTARSRVRRADDLGMGSSSCYRINRVIKYDIMLKTWIRCLPSHLRDWKNRHTNVALLPGKSHAHPRKTPLILFLRMGEKPQADWRAAASTSSLILPSASIYLYVLCLSRPSVAAQ